MTIEAAIANAGDDALWARVTQEVNAWRGACLQCFAAVEVAVPGKGIEKLSNPFDVATLFGLDPDRVIAEMAEMVTDETRRENMKEQTNIFRVLVKTLLNAGIITDRTKAFYAMYVDLDELKGEGDRMVGDDIAEEGIKYLQEINFKDRLAGTISIAAE